MKATRDPSREKELSYLRDRRNVGFDNPHGARLAIPRKKRRVNRINRHRIASALANLHGADGLEEAADAIAGDRPAHFKKIPASPLASAVADRSPLAQRVLERLEGRRP